MSGRAVIRLGALFAPLTLVCALYVPLLLLFLVTNPVTFRSEFGSPMEAAPAGVAYFGLALLAVGVGALLGGLLPLPRRLAPAFESPHAIAGARRRLQRPLRLALVVSIAAYLVWFAAGVRRAHGIGALVHAWLTNPEHVKETLLATVPGVTTLTQLAVAAVPLVVAFGLFGSRRGVRLLVVTVFALAAIRSVLFSERLALLELTVPVVYLLLSERRVAVPKAAVYGASLGVAVFTLFTVSELRRSYVYSHDFSVPRAAVRFLGYYTTSINNGFVVADHYRAATPFYETGQMLWLFPGIDRSHLDYLPAVGTVSLRYGDLFHVDPPAFWQSAFERQRLNPEFNVFSAPGFLAADFGWFAFAPLFLFGIASGALYQRARSSPYHRALYAVWLVGLLEFMRILYAFDTRMLPAYAVFGLVYVSLRLRAPEVVRMRRVSRDRMRSLERAGPAPAS